MAGGGQWLYRAEALLALSSTRPAGWGERLRPPSLLTETPLSRPRAARGSSQAGGATARRFDPAAMPTRRRSHAARFPSGHRMTIPPRRNPPSPRTLPEEGARRSPAMFRLLRRKGCAFCAPVPPEEQSGCKRAAVPRAVEPVPARSRAHAWLPQGDVSSSFPHCHTRSTN